MATDPRCSNPIPRRPLPSGKGDPCLCVFAGSTPGSDPSYVHAARRVGVLCAQAGWGVVYGGGGAGLMGELADAALAAGGRVEGMIPHSMVEREWAHPGLSDLHVVETMHERKQLMHDRCDAFLALPGGIGTFDELCETLTWQKLEIHRKPVAVLNTVGFFGPFLAALDHAVDQGFYGQADMGRLLVLESPEEIPLKLFGHGKEYSEDAAAAGRALEDDGPAMGSDNSQDGG